MIDACASRAGPTPDSLLLLLSLQLRSSLLAGAGADAATGKPSDCSRAGRVRLRARQDESQQLLLLTAEGGSSVQPLQLGSDPAGWPAGAVGRFVAAAQSSDSTVLPRLSAGRAPPPPPLPPHAARLAACLAARCGPHGAGALLAGPPRTCRTHAALPAW
jgi:hypothetical protein